MKNENLLIRVGSLIKFKPKMKELYSSLDVEQIYLIIKINFEEKYLVLDNSCWEGLYHYKKYYIGLENSRIKNELEIVSY